MSIYELARENDREALAELLLEADNAKVRFEAARALGELDSDDGHSNQGREYMLQALRTAAIDEPEEAVRMAAVNALEHHGINELRKVVHRLTGRPIGEIDSQIFPQLATSDRPELRLLSMAAIGQDTNLNSAEIVLNAIDDPNPKVRERAITAAMNLGLSRSEPQLRSALNDEYSIVRVAAATALGNLNLKSATEDLVDATNDPDESVQIAALDALATLGSPAAIEPLAQALQSSSDAMNRYAIYGLLELLTNVSGDASHRLRERVQTVVDGAPTSAVLETVIELLDDIERIPQQRNAVWLLSQLIEERITEDAIETLTDLVGDDDDQTAKLATGALVKCDGAMVERTVRHRFEEIDADSREAGQLAYILGRVGTDRSVDLLEQTLDHTDNDGVRQQVVSALNRLDTTSRSYG